MYEKAYLRNDEDGNRLGYCLFNKLSTRDVPPRFIASAEFDPLIDDSRLLHQTLQALPAALRIQNASRHAARLSALFATMTIADDALQDGARSFAARMKTPR